MNKIGMFFCCILIINAMDAACPRKLGTKRCPKPLTEVVITPQNLITTYKGSSKKFFDLLHTKLTVKPDFAKKTLSGIAELTLQPHFYDQNRLTLDAKYFKINDVFLKTPTNETKKLPFIYDTLKLTIDLEKYYTRNDKIKIVIDYTAQPYTQDSLQVEAGRGMYFINTEGKNPYKPMHLWTQGEEESSSCWFPTFEAVNQKTTEEIYVTLDTGMVSLSNGLLVETKINGDGTKTDYWKQDKPHSPYLFFLGIGNYYINKDKWRDKEVTAYTFPKYKEGVSTIFKNLPNMMEYFSQLLGVDYPWDKLGNMMAYDYTAGAMENTSAILYFDKMLCNNQQLIDDNFDYIIAHELFHQWFGDLVTAESWANLTLNESMADYSEYLWFSHIWEKEESDAYRYHSVQKYIQTSKNKNEPIVNYYYDTPHDVFDNIRYEKGGGVLHMLRNYLGDAAFFTAIHKYLSQYKFENTELSDLRKCFEEVSGEDLNWFFNQWWLSKGHPILEITHKYDEKNKTIELNIRQKQTEDFGPIFRIPTKVDIYVNGKKETKIIDINDKIKTFYFASATMPQLINFDADKVLICEKTEDLTDAENIFKYYNAPLFADKIEALKALATHQKDNAAIQEVLLKTMQDKNHYLRTVAINLIEWPKFQNKVQLSLALQQVIHTDQKSAVREKAIAKLAMLDKEKSVETMLYVLENDSSFLCLAKALTNLNYYNKPKAYDYAKKLSTTESPVLMQAVADIFKDTTIDNLAFFQKTIWLNTPMVSYNNFKSIGIYLENASSMIVERGILFLKDVYKYEESNFNKIGAKQVIQNLNYYFNEKAKKSQDADIKVHIIKKIAPEMLN